MIIITGKQLADELKSLGFERVEEPRDSRYACPSPEWLVSFGEYCFKHQPSKYGQGDGSDCDDAALWAVDQARRAANFNPACKGAGHSFCYCTVRIPLVATEHEEDGQINELNGITGPRNHTTNIVRGDDACLYFFEPQTGRFMDGAEAVRTGRVSALPFVLP